MTAVRSLTALLVLAGLCGGCRPTPPATKSAARPNVLLVTLDTVRADYLGCYGRASAETRTIDALAARGVLFATGVAHVPLTGPSHASILTGLNPLRHGFRNNAGYELSAHVTTAAEVFRGAGYRTAAFVSGFPLDARFGFDRGFEVYDDHLPRGEDKRRAPYLERFADATTDALLRWREGVEAARDGRPWFVWLHYYDPHAPYEPPPPLAQRFRSAPYDGEIAFVDRQLARVLGPLDAGRVLVLLTADHGESLGEHGEDAHGLFVYDAALRVPWILSGPGVAAGQVAQAVARGIDVLPTLLDYAGLPAVDGVDGRSLRPAAEGRRMADAPVYSESLFAELELGWAPLHAWRTARYKFILAPRPELFDLAADAAEVTNLVQAESERAGKMGDELRALLARPVPEASAAVDTETAERLAALGYVGAARPPGAARSGRDPKDGLALLARINRGAVLARTDPPTAIRELSAALAEDPALVTARRTRIVAYDEAGLPALAIADLRVLQEQGVFSSDDAVVLADNLRHVGKLDEALAVLTRTAREDPRFAKPWLAVAEIHIGRKQHREATAAYEQALKIAPDHIEALRGLGDVALLEGNLPAAQSRYGRILELDPTDALAMTKLGIVHMRAGRPAEALALFRRAVELVPDNPEVLLYLAGALASGGRSAEAVPYFERVLVAWPRSVMALNGLGFARLDAGDRRGAADAFRRSLRIDPKQPEVSRYLAELADPISN